jgi:hypothetical protein
VLNKILLLLFYFLPIGIYSQDWVKLTDLEERFNIQFPQHPIYKIQEFKNQQGNVVNESYSVANLTDHPNQGYALNILSYDHDLVDLSNQEDIEELLTNTSLDLAQINRMKISYSKINYQEDSGKPYLDLRAVSKNEKQVLRSRIWLSKRRMVTLQVYSTGVNSLNEFIDKFIQSYEDPDTKAK